jgi:hypothetical protein
MAYGFTITNAGWVLIGNLIANGDANLSIDEVLFGTGKVPDNTNPATMETLIEPFATGTSNNPRHHVYYNLDGSVERVEVAFTVEYRSDLNPQIDYGVWLNEFGMFAYDKYAEKLAMIYYATLGEAPQYVTPISQNAVDIRRFSVKIVITDKVEITMSYDMDGFVTGEEMVEYAETLKPEWLKLSQAQVDAHNNAPFEEVHEPLRNAITSNTNRITNIEKTLNGGGSASFYYDFLTLEGLNLISGVWNPEDGRVEF